MLRLPKALFPVIKEILRHLLRRPVAGVCVLARTKDGRILLIRRGDTGEWALPGGTVEWGETFRSTAVRELLEEAGVTEVELGPLLGAYSAPDRDPRFHAVTLVVGAQVGQPTRPPVSEVEILDVRLFAADELPSELSHGNRDMLEAGLAYRGERGGAVWE